MKTYTVQSTNNYSLFLAHEHQRKMSNSHVNALAESIREHGFLPSKPVECYRKGDKFVVIDGHHRLKAAELAGAFVYYIVVDKANSALIAPENILVKKWTTFDYIAMYVDQGKTDYEKILEYCGRGVPLETVLALGLGRSTFRSDDRAEFQRGNYKIESTNAIEGMLRIVDRLHEIAPNIKKKSYCDALGCLLQVGEFSVDIFLHKSEMNPRAFVNCATRDQALQVIEEVYNFRNQLKVSLSLLAKQAGEVRSRAGLKNARVS